MIEKPYECNSYPTMVVISGPSGVGKDTVAREVIKRRPEDFYFVVTAASREPRPGEVHGRDYFFVSNDEFARMIDENELLEYAIVYREYKGIPKQQIRDALESGKNVIMRVDVQGAATVRKLIPNAITVFLVTPSEEDLVKRLTERASEDQKGLKLRIATARKEMERIEEFDYCVVNADSRVDCAVDTILSIVDAARSRVHQQSIIL
ncbi:MAG: guanylate kinase [Candidatus Promineifilaceae bacterium]|nr:guanylate kinase [Candidatus Promineifilaceae bacterium]